VLDHDQPRIRRDDDSFGGDGTVRDVRGFLVKRGNSGDELPRGTTVALPSSPKPRCSAR
jgi:hypothetical protein